MKPSTRFYLGAAICVAILSIAAFSSLPILVLADTEAEKAIKKAEAATAQAEQAAKEAAEAQKAADEAGKKAGQEPTPEDKAADDAAKEADDAAEKADEAQDKAQEEQLEAEDAAKDAKEAGGSNEEKNKKAAEEKKEADDAAEAAKKAEEEAVKKEKEADAADKKADAADKKIENRDLKKKKADARLKRKRARDARRRAAKAIRDARRLLHEATRTGQGSESEKRKKRLDDLTERLKRLMRRADDSGKTEEPPKEGNFLPPGEDQKGELKTANGLHTVTFNLVQGRVIAQLPDDMRAGDTISGTVLTEPKGNSAEEKAKNQNILNTTVLDLEDMKIPADRPMFRWTPTIPQPDMPVRYQIRIVEILGGPIPEGMTQPVVVIPWYDPAFGTPISIDPTIKQPGAATTPDPPTTPNFNIPTLGQTGRLIVITGPFDGDASNTTLGVTPPQTNVQDFEKGTQNVSSGFGLIAESPRKAVFRAPSNFIGSTNLTLKEGNVETKATYRNLAVNLSAPKTNLLKGERTTLTVAVSGLAGLTKPAPLQLDATGVILMDGGNFQNLRINPSEVDPAGRYTTTRAITGQQAGAFTVVATVVVSPFDVCIQGDSLPDDERPGTYTTILWNTFTGEYRFTNPGAPPKPAGQPPSGVITAPGGKPPAPPGGTSLTGTGKPTMRGCIITLSHNAPDRRVFARLDACTKTGDAEVQTTTPATKVAITDKNVTDNACSPR